VTERVVALRLARRVTDVSLLACGEAFDLAASRLAGGGVFEAGVHLCLVGSERPVSAPASIPTLLRNGRFRSSWPAVAAAVAAGLVRVAEVEREWEAQIARVRDAGFRVTHVDGHQHLHLLPRLFPVVLSLARLFEVPFVRAPRRGDPAATAGAAFAARARARLLSRFGESARRQLARAGHPEPPRVLGLAEAGRMTLGRWKRLLNALPSEGTFEVVLHPGVSDEETREKYRWGYSWSEETEALESAELVTLFSERGVDLVSFGELT
jgi:predicted glycoside hydrolase/deacetylase ChbG (UPF0249 family)